MAVSSIDRKNPIDKATFGLQMVEKLANTLARNLSSVPIDTNGVSLRDIGVFRYKESVDNNCQSVNSMAQEPVVMDTSFDLN